VMIARRAVGMKKRSSTTETTSRECIVTVAVVKLREELVSCFENLKDVLIVLTHFHSSQSLYAGLKEFVYVELEVRTMQLPNRG
jgi:hypothetical protein